MSPELDTLDQLLGDDLPLSTIRKIFQDDRRFAHAIVAMLNDGQVILRTTDGETVAPWQWRVVVEGMTDESAAAYWLSLTAAGARRVC
jgi:hypothetical protein